MLKLLSSSLLDRQQAYIDLMANLYRIHGVPFYAAHCGCPESSEPIPVIVFGAHSQLQCKCCGRMLDAELIYERTNNEIRPALDVSEEEYVDLCYRLTNLPARATLFVSIFFAAYTAQQILTSPGVFPGLFTSSAAVVLQCPALRSSTILLPEFLPGRGSPGRCEVCLPLSYFP